MTAGREERAHGSRCRRTTPWRGLLACLLMLAISGSSGCMVLDELDTAAAKMPTSAAEKEKKKAGANAPAAGAAGAAGAAERLAATKRMLHERSQKWWSEAKTMTPGESTEGIVSCRLPEGRQFMTKDDCLAQGGQTSDGRS